MSKPIRLLTVALLILMAAGASRGWIGPARHVNALSFFKDGRVEFTLFESGTTGNEFHCAPGTTRPQWFVITPCTDQDASCLASVDRMASMLLAAKLSGKAVHIGWTDCEVTEVALKP